jgi:hypothetical protein
MCGEQFLSLPSVPLVFLQILINFSLINSLGEIAAYCICWVLRYSGTDPLTVNKEVLYLFVFLFCNRGRKSDGSCVELRLILSNEEGQVIVS